MPQQRATSSVLYSPKGEPPLLKSKVLRYSFLLIFICCLQSSENMWKQCDGIVDRVEDNQVAVLLIETEKQELLVEMADASLQEGDRVTLRKHAGGQCVYFTAP